MQLPKYAILLTALIWLALQAAPLAQAQRRRVFTNEDVAAPASAQPAAETPAESSPTPPAEGTAPRAAPASAEKPKGELGLVLELHEVLRNASELYSEKLGAETDENLRARWDRIVNYISSLMQENQQVINELQAEQEREKQRQAEEPQAEQQSPPEPAPR